MHCGPGRIGMEERQTKALTNRLNPEGIPDIASWASKHSVSAFKTMDCNGFRIVSVTSAEVDTVF